MIVVVRISQKLLGFFLRFWHVRDTCFGMMAIHVTIVA
jgi:hypothetical protein